MAFLPYYFLDDMAFLPYIISMNRSLEYPCTLEEDEETGGFVASIPDIPEALTGGKTVAEALGMAEDALSVAMTFYLEEDKDVPLPSRRKAGQYLVSPSALMSLKVALREALKESGKRPADLARMMNLDFKGVSRVLDPNHATKLATLEAALGALGKRVLIATDDKAA